MREALRNLWCWLAHGCDVEWVHFSPHWKQVHCNYCDRTWVEPE